MPKIVITSLENQTLQTQQEGLRVLDVIHENFVDWMHACGGKGRCTTCSMIVVEGMEHLTPETDRELHYRNLGRLKKNERLCCQARLLGDITIRVPQKYRFPHIQYTD